MNFDNLYKVAKTFLVFSIALLIFSFSIKLWNGGGCHSTVWKTKHTGCFKDGNIDVEIFAIAGDELDFNNLVGLLNDKDLPDDIKIMLKNKLFQSREINEEFIKTLDDGSIKIMKFKTIIDDGN